MWHLHVFRLRQKSDSGRHVWISRLLTTVCDGLNRGEGYLCSLCVKQMGLKAWSCHKGGHAGSCTREGVVWILVPEERGAPRERMSSSHIAGGQAGGDYTQAPSTSETKSTKHRQQTGHQVQIITHDWFYFEAVMGNMYLSQMLVSGLNKKGPKHKTQKGRLIKRSVL